MKDLTVNQWQKMSLGDRDGYCRRLVSVLPPGFEFREVVRYELGSQANEVALFSYQNAAFALLPANESRLGYDPERKWEPTKAESESWQATSRQYGFTQPIHEHIAAITLKPRTVRVGAMLVETCPQEFGWENIDPEAPEIREDIKKHRGQLKHGSQFKIIRPGVSLLVSQDKSGGLNARICRYPTHQKISQLISVAGFRFPTSDEWEYICGSGAETLFRWGDHAPCDHYPIGRKSGAVPWNLHRAPNAYGLQIAFNPYKSELLAEPGMTRGGDGGFAVCGGTGYFVGWLPLATSYFEDFTCKMDRDEPINPEYKVGRRVFPLG